MVLSLDINRAHTSPRNILFIWIAEFRVLFCYKNFILFEVKLIRQSLLCRVWQVVLHVFYFVGFWNNCSICRYIQDIPNERIKSKSIYKLNDRMSLLQSVLNKRETKRGEERARKILQFMIILLPGICFFPESCSIKIIYFSSQADLQHFKFSF